MQPATIVVVVVVVVSFLLDSTTAQQQQFQNCTPCDIPLSLEAGAKAFGNFNCSEWEEDARWDPSDSEICKLNRIAGLAFCGCEVPKAVTESCDLCPNGSIDIDLDRELPDVRGVTCGDVLTVPAVDGQETCTLLQSKYAFWCDCPRAVPTCTLCPNGNFPPKPDKGLPFDTNLFCGDIATEFLVSTPRQCNELLTEIPVDLASYCECPGTEPPETCQLCPDGYEVNDYVIVENDLTCGDVHQIARFSTNETVCEIMEDVHDTCCSKTDAWFAESDGGEDTNDDNTANDFNGSRAALCLSESLLGSAVLMMMSTMLLLLL